MVFANSNTAYDTILVAEGVYHPLYNLNLETDSVLKTFHVGRSNLAILGGYATGGATRNVTQYRTILDGNIGNPNDSADNVTSVVSIAPESPSGQPINYIEKVVLDGFEIRNGYSLSASAVRNPNYGLSAQFGTTIQTALAEVSVTNCKIYNNHGESSIFELNVGAIIKFNNNEVYDNTVNSGRLISFIIALDVEIVNNNFYNNKTNEGVQSLQVSGVSKAFIANNTFKNNTPSTNSSSNIAIRFIALDTLIYQNNILEGSDSTFSTFGMDNVRRSYIGNNQFYNNKYTMYLIVLMSDTVTFVNNLIHNNTPIDTSLSKLIGFSSKEMNFLNNTIANEKTYNIFEYVLVDTSLLKAKNNIIFGCTIYDPNQLIANSPINFKNSYIQNSIDTSNGNLNGTVDPMFVHPSNNYQTTNFKLMNCSPLIDNGDTTGISHLLGAQDLALMNRYKNTVDIGAYEYQNEVINPNYIATATVTDASTNALPLIQLSCEEDGWTYYAHPTNTDSIVFAISWNNNSSFVRQSTQVYVEVDNSVVVKTNATNDSATTHLPRRWFIDYNGTAPTEPIDIRFFFATDDSIKVANDAINNNRQVNSPITWVGLETHFDPQNVFTYNSINNNNYQSLTGVVNQINGIQYIEFSQVEKWISGTGFIKSVNGDVSIANIGNDIATVYPNPATNTLYIQSKVNGSISIKNIQGATIWNSTKTQTLEALDIQHLHAGMYLLELIGEHGTVQVKFIKQ